MGQFNSDDNYIYYCEHESLRRNGVALIVSKKVQNSVLRYNLKNNRRDDSTHGHHQMINTEIRLIIFFAAKD